MPQFNLVSRPEVYRAVDSERDYQDRKWNENTCPSKGLHSVQEWLTYIRDYTEEALHIGCRESDATAIPKQLDIIRKIAGMGVCAMEQNGAPLRK
jgi:hypothetical protein